jgi:hypothetical protein
MFTYAHSILRDHLVLQACGHAASQNHMSQPGVESFGAGSMVSHPGGVSPDGTIESVLSRNVVNSPTRRPKVAPIIIPAYSIPILANDPATSISGTGSTPRSTTFSYHAAPSSSAGTSLGSALYTAHSGVISMHTGSELLSMTKGKQVVSSASAFLSAGTERWSPLIDMLNPTPPPSTSCKAVAPAPVWVPCPCCPPDRQCRERFLLKTGEKLPENFREHAAASSIHIPNTPKQDLAETGAYPRCPMSGCAEEPQLLWRHIKKDHFPHRLLWKCECSPSQTYASRNSLNNHIRRKRGIQ